MEFPERADRLGGLLGVVADKRTYKNLGYLLLAMPLGIAYYAVVLLGLGVGTILLFVAIGAPIVIATILGTRLLAALERALANALLDLDLEAPTDVSSATGASGDGVAAALRRYLEAPSTWRGLGFLLLKVWIGVVAFVLLFLLVTVLSLLASPFRYPHEVEFGRVNEQPVTWAIDTGPELALAVALGIGLGLAFLHVANGVAYLAGRIAVALLDGPAAPGAGARDDSGDSDASAAAAASNSSPEPPADAGSAEPAPEDRGSADAGVDSSREESNGRDSRPDGSYGGSRPDG